jgi:hypothetical protein
MASLLSSDMGKTFSSIDLGVPFITSQRFFRRSMALSFKYGDDGLHTLLNGVLGGSLVTLAWKC